MRPSVLLAVLLSVAAGCAGPRLAIPTERAIFDGRAYAFGRIARASPGGEVIEVKRAGPHEDLSIFVRRSDGRLDVEVLEAGRSVPRPPTLGDLEEAADLLSPRNPAWGRGLGRWLAERTDPAALERGLAAEIEARRGSNEGLIGDLAAAYRDARAMVELHEQEARRRNTVFAGLFGWQRGAFSGYSWSFPFHVERYDRSEDVREVAIFPLLSGARSEHDGLEAASVPLLAYLGRIETSVDRTEGMVLFGTGYYRHRSIAGSTTAAFALPLLAFREKTTGEDVAADRGCVTPGERSATHLFASLVSWSSERPGIYRDRGALKTVGRERSAWRVLPLASHREDERGHETVIWPLLGFGWGTDDGQGYLRLFYFLRLGG